MKALIVEDEPQTIEAVSLIFKLRWPEVELLSTTRGSEAALMVEKESPDVVILDLGLPDVDGIEVLKEIRAFSDVPVIIVTARGDSISQVKGLELGADDYVTKPFDPGVLLVRVKNTLAHARIPLNQGTAPFAAGNLIIDFANRQVSFRGKLLDLTPTEYRLLCHLARNAGRVLSHDNILRAVWGEGYENTDILRACIYQLRQKLTQAGANPGIISVERGVGYKFVVPR
ncbi:MAG: DNA-binding response regulator [Chloroflexi bacterium CG07_land_8_20_14_0_80_51_10]|nr:MAG: DNA-binding response regulator [Chloroflexi bacterium CG07_land_8_20_14_0_80_51_10]